MSFNKTLYVTFCATAFLASSSNSFASEPLTDDELLGNYHRALVESKEQGIESFWHSGRSLIDPRETRWDELQRDIAELTSKTGRGPVKTLAPVPADCGVGLFATSKYQLMTPTALELNPAPASEGDFKTASPDVFRIIANLLDVPSLAALDKSSVGMGRKIAKLKNQVAFRDGEKLYVTWADAKKFKISHIKDKPWMASFQNWVNGLNNFRFKVREFIGPSLAYNFLSTIKDPHIVFYDKMIMTNFWGRDLSERVVLIATSNGKGGLIVLNASEVTRRINELPEQPEIVLDPSNVIAKWIQAHGGHTPYEETYASLKKQKVDKKVGRDALDKHFKALRDQSIQAKQMKIDLKNKPSPIREEVEQLSATGDIKTIDKMIYGLMRGAYGFKQDKTQILPKLIDLFDHADDTVLSNVFQGLIDNKINFNCYYDTPNNVFIALHASISKKTVESLKNLLASLVSLNYGTNGPSRFNDLLKAVNVRFTELN